MLWGKKFHFGHLGGIFYSFDPLGFTNQIFIRVKDTKIMCISSFFHVFGEFQKNLINGTKIMGKNVIFGNLGAF